MKFAERKSNPVKKQVKKSEEQNTYFLDLSKKKICYRYDPVTKVFRKEGVCHIDPVQSNMERKDVYAAIPNTTFIKPPEPGKEQVPVFDPDTETWYVEPYFDKAVFYDKSTGQSVVLNGLNIVPDDTLTRESPPSLYHKWDNVSGGYVYTEIDAHIKNRYKEIDHFFRQKDQEDFSGKSSKTKKTLTFSIEAFEDADYRKLSVWASLCKAGVDGFIWYDVVISDVDDVEHSLDLDGFLEVLSWLYDRNRGLIQRSTELKAGLKKIKKDKKLTKEEKFKKINAFKIK